MQIIMIIIIIYKFKPFKVNIMSFKSQFQHHSTGATFLNSINKKINLFSFTVLATCIITAFTQAQAATNVIDKSKKQETKNTAALPTITVVGIRNQSGTAMVEKSSKTGSIEEALGLKSQVQTASNAFKSLQGGEIRPPQISISGGRPYENLYIIDGLSNNNYITPEKVQSNIVNSQGRSDYFNDFRKGSDPAATAQSYNLSVDQLENIEIEDSRISVKYSGFTGGVVKAETRKPDTTRFGGKVYYGHSRSSWDIKHYDEDQLKGEDFYKSYDATRQPDYTKHSAGVMLNIPFNNNWGAIVSYDRKDSKIPILYFAGNDPKSASLKDQRRKSETFLTTIGGRTASGLDIKLTGVYYKYNGDYFSSRAIKSGFSQDQETYDLSLKLSKDFDLGKGTAKFKYGQLRTARDIESSIYLPWLTLGDKNWGAPYPYSAEGSQASGSMSLKQRTLLAATDFEFNPIEIGKTKHKFALGAEIETILGHMKNGGYIDYIMTLTSKFNGALAPGQEGVGYNFARTNGAIPDQFFIAKNISPAFDRSARTQRISLWLEDTITFADFRLRPGVRFDYDDQFENFNIAPRVSGEWNVLGKDRVILKAGAGRYYGGPNLYHALYKGLFSTRYQRKGLDPLPDGTLPPFEFKRHWMKGADYIASEMETPYSDEFSAGFDLHLPRGFHVDYNFINRDSKKGITEHQVKTKDGDTTYAASNDGRGNFRSHTLSLTNDYFANHFFSLSATWSRTRSSFTDYKTFTLTDYDEKLKRDRSRVIYEGNLIDASKLDAGQFNTPWNIVGLWRGRLSKNVLLSTTLTWKGKTPVLLEKGWEKLSDGTQVKSYEKKELPRRFTVDMSLEVELFKKRNSHLKATVDVFNVFNRKNINGMGFIKDRKTDKKTYFNYYAPGRSVQARLEYVF